MPGEGKCLRSIILVGEAPGEVEDRTGRPFVGRTGRFLDGLFSELGVFRDDFFITSSVKCRPPANRDPRRTELDACRAAWLAGQIEAVDPALVVALGLVAARTLLGETAGKTPLRDLRKSKHVLESGRTCRVTYHPSAGMRFPKTREMLAADLTSCLE